MNSSIINIGAKRYSVASLSDDDFNFLLAKKSICDDDIKAFIDYDDQYIVVRDRLSKEHKRELILHEILHALLEDAGIEQCAETERLIQTIAPRINSSIHEIQVIMRDMMLI